MRHLWFIAVCLTALLIGGCVSSPQEATPTPLLQPTETLTPTATIDWFPRTATPTLFIPEVTITPMPTLIDPGYSQIHIQDAFADSNLWMTGPRAQGNITLDDQTLVFALSGAKSELISLSTFRLPGDFFLEVTAEASLCSPDDAYGIIFWRFSEMGTYTFLLNCQGQFRIERQINESLAVLVDWTTGSRIQPGSPSRHQITIWAEAGSLQIYVDSTLQYTLQTRSNLWGGLGLTTRSAGELPETILFSDLIVTTP